MSEMSGMDKNTFGEPFPSGGLNNFSNVTDLKS